MYAKDSWRAGEALLIATITPYPYCSPGVDTGELKRVAQQQLNVHPIAGNSGECGKQEQIHSVARDSEALWSSCAGSTNPEVLGSGPR